MESTSVSSHATVKGIFFGANAAIPRYGERGTHDCVLFASGQQISLGQHRDLPTSLTSIRFIQFQCDLYHWFIPSSLDTWQKRRISIPPWPPLLPALLTCVAAVKVEPMNAFPLQDLHPLGWELKEDITKHAFATSNSDRLPS